MVHSRQRLLQILKRHSVTGALLALMLFHGLANGWWLAADNHPIRTDEETHMLMAREYYSALFPFNTQDRSIAARFKALTLIKPGNPAHPPLLHLAGAAMIALFGYSTDVLAATTTIFFWLALTGMYLILRRFLAPDASLFTVTVVSFTPMIYAASRFFMTDYLSMTLVVWAILFLLQSNYLRRTRYAMLFGACCGLGLLARITSLLYCLGPFCIAIAAGLWTCCSHNEQDDPAARRRRRLTLNLVLIGLAAAVVCGPWYYLNFDRFFGFWLRDHPFLKQSPVTFIQSDSDADVVVSDHNAPPSVSNNASAYADKEQRTSVAGTDALRIQAPRRAIPPLRYPLFVINNGMFLPSFCLAALGSLCCLFVKRLRTRETLYLGASILVSYLLMTLLMRFANPRYALQVMPFLAAFAALPLLIIPVKRIRWLLQTAFLALLALQFGILTVAPQLPGDGIAIPMHLDPDAQQLFREPGLFLMKNALTLSDAYTHLSAPEKRNYKQEIFDALMCAENELNTSGMEGRYLRLNMRGMTLEEPHYWPDDGFENPFRREDYPEDCPPWRRLRDIAYAPDLETLQPKLWRADYVVYAIDQTRSEEETKWVRRLSEAGFSPCHRFAWEQYGRMQPQYYGILARPSADPLPHLTIETDLANMTLFQLHELRYSRSYGLAEEEQQSRLDAALQKSCQEAGAQQPFNNAISFVAFYIMPHEHDVYRIFLLMFADRPIDYECRFELSGQPVPQSASSSGEMKPEEEVWQLQPSPPTRHWKAGTYILFEERLSAEPGLYELSLQTHARHHGPWGAALPLGPHEFSPEEKAP